ncbi:hypothetical protein [Kiloniella sp.]|uniref:hypothetical protein n=1 Tax=Kiloniella sp. TaxID=1938587 RepID=UPI003B02CC5E
MLIVIYLLYVKLSETIHINRLLGGRHLFLLNKAEKSQFFQTTLHCSIYRSSFLCVGAVKFCKSGTNNGRAISRRHNCFQSRRPSFGHSIRSSYRYSVPLQEHDQ